MSTKYVPSGPRQFLAWPLAVLLGLATFGGLSPSRADTLTLIPAGAGWRYLDTGAYPGPTWTAPTFDDTNWPVGPAQLGFGDGDEQTILRSTATSGDRLITAYFRHEFEVDAPDAITELTARLIYDDGAVVYLNGVEVVRVSMPAGPVNYSTVATAVVPDDAEHLATLDRHHLLRGRNVVAVEVHQASAVSTDLSFDLAVSAQRDAPPPVNLSPQVLIVTPGEGSTFTAGTTITLGADAPDPDGQVVAVAFFAGTTKLGDAEGPFVTPKGAWLFNWRAAPVGEYELSARATDDQGATAISTPVHIRVLESGPALRLGYLRWEIYDNIPGLLVSDLTNHSSFPDHPTAVQLLSAFETPAQYGEDYGARLSGFLLPPVSGDYVFYLSSDDQGVLFLSTDEQPAHTAEIAREPAWSLPRNWRGPATGREHNENISIPIRLEAGRRYYVEALMKEAGGGDQLGVAWQLPGEPEPANGSPPIGGEFLATWADGTPEPRELHVVGIHEGLVGTPGAGGDPARAAVVVNRPGKRVTLFLSSYNPVLWHVTVFEGSLVEKVILGGYHVQAVEGLPPGVEVVPAFYEGGVSDYLWLGYAIESGQFLRTVPRLHEKTGLEIASFQGGYRPPAGTQFLIDTVQQDPRLRSDYPQPIPLSELPTLNFSLTFWNESGPLAVTHKTYTLTGPDDNARWLLPGMRVVSDAGQQYLYGTRSQSVLRVNSLTGAMQEMGVGSGVPELSWPMGVAYDSLRQRILVVSLGGEGYLYAYAPDTQRWSLVANMDNRDFECLAYHPPQDMLYGLKVHHADGEKPVLYRLDAAGKFQGEIPLPLLPYDVGPSGYQAELASAGDYLVLLLAPQSWPPHGPATHDFRMYLIDPQSGQSWLAYRHVGPPENQPPSVRLSEPVDGAIVNAGDTVRLAAEASDPDGSVESVEFFTNGQSLGMGVRVSDTSPFQLLWTWPAPGSHRLSAKATDGEGASAVSGEVQITVRGVAPTIAQPPADQARFVGQSVTFSVTATGSPPLTYQWEKNAIPLVGASSASLDLAGVQAADAGYYRVIVANAFGAVTSTVATLTVRLQVVPSSDQSQPTVAGDRQGHLVVWTDARNRDRTDFDIYGARVGADGAVLDPGGLAICTAAQRQESPQVAFDGTNYLVVWSDGRDVGEGALTTHIYGARVDRDGRVLDPGGFRIGNGRVSENEPELAFNGTSYLVVWDDWREYETTICDIFGARVSPGGEVLDPDGLRISVKPLWQTWAHAAGLGDDFYVVWDDMGSVRGTLVRGTGEVVNPTGTWLGEASNEGQPAVAASQDQYLVTWHDSRFVQVPGGGGYFSNSMVLAKRINPQGAVLDATPLRLRTVNDALYHSDVAGAGGAFWAVWQEGENYGGLADVRGARVDGDGTISSPIEISLAAGEQMWPTVAASHAGGGLVVWADGRHSAGHGGGTHFIYGARLSPDGEVLEPAGILIGGLVKEAPLVVWPKPAEIVYGTPLDNAQLNAAANVPGTFAYVPPSGTWLNAGQAQTLTVTFTPEDETRYVVASASVTIDVRPVGLTIRADDQTKHQGEPNPPLTATYTGFVHGDTPASLDVPVTLTTTATDNSPPGEYPILASGARDADYVMTCENGTLTVLAPPSVVTRRLPNGGFSGAIITVELDTLPRANAKVQAVEDRPPEDWTVVHISHAGVFDARTGKVKFGPFFDAEPRVLHYQVQPPPGARGVFSFVGQGSVDGVSEPIGGDQTLLLVSYHPADGNPSDWQMGIDEVTAYGASWREGRTWPISPNPIPIDYVTRAAALWRGGECYTIAPEPTEPPLCWVSSEGGRGGMKLNSIDPVSSVTRVAPAVYIPGGVLRISLVVQPSTEVRAVAVEERLPAGVILTRVSDGGYVDVANRAIRWGPFLENTPRTLVYEAVPADTTAGPLGLAGVGSFDGRSIVAAGPGELREGCGLSVEAASSTGRFRLTLNGRTGARFLIESSEDLRTWTPVSQVTKLTGTTTIDNPSVGGRGGCFYRARQTE